MKRVDLDPRPDWRETLEADGCFYHTIYGVPYWNDAAAYQLTEGEVLKLERAGNDLHAMCLELCDDVVTRGDYDDYNFPDPVKEAIEGSWNNDHWELLGRFDFGFSNGELKMFEYNADTPTSLPETAVWQWRALEDRGWKDQFNSVHERLIERIPEVFDTNKTLYFTAMEDSPHEDWGNLHYLMEIATEHCGFNHTVSINIESIGWNGQVFTDINETPIKQCIKLYPWELMMRDEFGWNVNDAQCQFSEPAWKMLLSNKYLLPALWKRHYNHPLLLEAYKEEEFGNIYSKGGNWIRKPVLGREGANITTVDASGKTMLSNPIDPAYDKHGYVLQRKLDVNTFDGYYPVLGVWMVGPVACGLGIREEKSIITTNSSSFVPHYIE